MSNWRLPTKSELNEMYVQLHLQGIGNFSSAFYWSSSEYDSDHAWNLYFDYGYQYANNKDNHLRVRPVRDLPGAISNKGMNFSFDGQFFKSAGGDELKPMTWWYDDDKDDDCKGLFFSLDGRFFESAKKDDLKMTWHEAMMKYADAQ